MRPTRRCLRIVPASQSFDTAELDKVVEVLRGGNVVCVTGAGCSTESGIPDYRSPNGSYSKGYKPMTHQEFMKSEFQRKRYWARSAVSWPYFSKVKPNGCHVGIEGLMGRGLVSTLITQNVDGLHRHEDTIHLHGRLSSVRCMDCGEVTNRDVFQKEILELNPVLLELLHKGESMDRSDGDVDFEDRNIFETLQVPPCPTCTSTVVKPNVVLFGDSVPTTTVAAAMSRVSSSSAVLCLGTSLMVYSSWRFIKQAHQLSIPIFVINIGATRADDIAALKIEARVAEVMPAIMKSI